MKRWLPFILPLLATSAFAHVPDPVLSTTLKNSQLSTLNSHAYTYLTGGQRATQARTDASSVTYNYDAIGQLKKALGTGGQSTENLGFGYDAAWNLSKRTNGAAIQTFNVDGKNQMTSVPDGACVYDANGNLTSAKGGLQKFGYDEENRLVAFTNYLSVTKPDARTAFYYDGLSRLRVRREYAWVPDNNPGGAAVPGAGVMSPGGGTWQLSSETRYVYDGRRVIQERNGSNTPLVSYTRGKDLSGSLEGAGGIGGLLGRSHGYNSGSGAWSTHNAYHADGAGNVTYLLAANQTLAASYRYDPYGNLLASSGTLAAANVYRYSSKELHLNSGLYSYGYRFYSANWQRWLNQDPLGIDGGMNLYGFVGNDPVDQIDPDGLFFKTSFGEMAHELYQKMMGDRSGSYDQDGNMAQRVAMLGNDGADTLDKAMQEGFGILGDQLTDYFAGQAAGKILGAGLGVVCKVAKKAVKPLAKGVAPTAAKNVTKEIRVRPTPGRDGATSTHIIERVDGQVNSVTHQVTKDGKVLHQHQTHVGKYGTERRFPDEWIEYPKE